MNIIAAPLGWIMKACYHLVKNYGVALLLFTLITRAIMFPLNIKQQKNTAKQAMLKPELEKLQRKYGNNKEKFQEEQMNLYAKAGINPMAGCLPMLLSFVILFALIPVVYGPLTYVSDADKKELEASNAMISNLYTVSSEVKENDKSLENLIKKCSEDTSDEKEIYKNVRKKLTDEKKYKKTADLKETQLDDVMEAIKKHNDIDKFILNEDYFSSNLIQSRPELMTFVFTEKENGKYSDVLPATVYDAANDFDYSFFGLFLGKIPTFKDLSCIIPLISFALQIVSTFVSQHYSKKNNPEMAQQMGSMNIMMIAMSLFSLWITFKYPAGLGLYWCYSSLFGVAQIIILNKVYTPERMAVMIEKENAKNKKKNNGKMTFMERMAEAQMIQSGKDPEEIRRLMAENRGETYEPPKKKSQRELKDEQRRKLNEARKRMAEKYGDEYIEDEETDNKNNKNKKK